MIRSLLAVTVAVLTMTIVQADEGKAPSVKLTADEKALIDLVNKERAKEKLTQLVVNPLLCKVSKQHTDNMAKQEKMAHMLDGKGVAARVTDAGYDYRKVAENLAQATGDADAPAPPPADVHAGWMKSKGHRGNILEPKYTEVGVYMERSKKGTYFYTMVFGVPRK